MFISTRLLTGIVLLACGVASASSVPVPLLRAMGWEIEAKPTREPASQKAVVILQRLKAKDLLTRDLLNGERGLFEVAAWFQTLNASPSEYPDEHWRTQPGRSDGEKVCRQVIAWATAHMQQSHPHSYLEMRVHRLEEELRQHIASHGKVVLPE